MPTLGLGLGVPFRRTLGSVSCAYALNADSTEVAAVGFLPMTLSESDQKALFALAGGGSNRQAIAFATGAAGGTSVTIDLSTGTKAIEWAPAMPASAGGGAAVAAFQLEMNLTTQAFSNIAQVKFETKANAAKSVQVYIGASLAYSSTPASYPARIGIAFDSATETAYVAFDDVPVVSAHAYTPDDAIATIAVYEKTACPAGDAAKTVGAQLFTRVDTYECAAHPEGSTDACGNSISGWLAPATPTHATAFSPTARGGVGTTFGIWADGGLRVVRHESLLQWLGVRTMAGIASGDKVSCWATVTGTAQDIGLGLGNASVDLSTYSGADANGFVLFGHVPDVYHNGGSVLTTTGTLSQNDVVRMDVDRVNDTVQWYKQTGGTGSFVSMGAALSISVLGSGLLYPVSNGYRDTSILTWDFGQGGLTPASGFTAGPTGQWGWWADTAIASAMTDTWLATDTTRMWELNTQPGTAAPNVVNNDPVGAWYGVQYARVLLQATAGQRPTYTTAGMVLDASGGNKVMSVTLPSSLAQTDPFTVLICGSLTAGKPIRTGRGTANNNVVAGAFSASGINKEHAIVRGTTTALAADAIRADTCIVVTFDGTNAYALDSDGTWTTLNIGTGTGLLTHDNLRALTAESTVGTVTVRQSLSGAVTEDQARNLQWSARNVL